MSLFPYPEGALLMAPLSGYTDLPYRRAARKCGCVYAFTEMVDAASLAYARKRSESMLLRGGDEPFLGVQLVGANEEHLKIALDVLNEYEFDVLDFNLGCPVPKVVKKGGGCELMRQPTHLGKMISDGCDLAVDNMYRFVRARPRNGGAECVCTTDHCSAYGSVVGGVTIDASRPKDLSKERQQ